MTSGNRPTSGTLVAERKPRWFAIVVTALYGAVVLWPLTADRFQLGTGELTPKSAIWWAIHIPGTAFTAILAVVIVAVIWGWVRAWRMALHLDPQGVTVRNYFRTHRFGWAEVISLVDGSVNKDYWALSLLAADGQAVTASGTASRLRARAETLTAIRQTAGCHGIAARLTGRPGGAWRPIWQSRLLATHGTILLFLFVVGWSLVVGNTSGPTTVPLAAVMSGLSRSRARTSRRSSRYRGRIVQIPKLAGRPPRMQGIRREPPPAG